MRALVLVLLVPLTFLVAPAQATNCIADPSTPLGDEHYVYTSTRRDNVGVSLLGGEIREDIFLWPMGARAEIWQETNGVAGLQRRDGPCGEADFVVVGASTGAGRPLIPL